MLIKFHFLVHRSSLFTRWQCFMMKNFGFYRVYIHLKAYHIDHSNFHIKGILREYHFLHYFIKEG